MPVVLCFGLAFKNDYSIHTVHENVSSLTLHLGSNTTDMYYYVARMAITAVYVMCRQTIYVASGGEEPDHSVCVCVCVRACV